MAEPTTITSALDKNEPLPPPSVHAAAHYGTWLGREAHRHNEPKAGAFRNAARMLAVLEAEIFRLHAELIAAQQAAPQPTERDALRDAAAKALHALEKLNGIDTETESVTIYVSDEIDALRDALGAPQCSR